MASPSVTYTFSNSTTADASQVNQNFTDLINGASDATKDYSINALTCAGTATLNGSVNLGNASGDDLTITASLASSVAIKTTFSYDVGSATIGIKSIYFGSNDSAARSTRIIAGAVSSSYTLTLPTAVSAGAARILESTTGGALSFSSRTDLAVVSKANAQSPYAATRDDDVILGNSTSGLTIDLPSAATSKKHFRIVKTDTSTGTFLIARGGSDTINGATSTTLTRQYESIDLVSDGGTAWTVFNRNIPATTQTWTPTGSWTANATYTGFYSVSGDWVDLFVKIAIGALPTPAVSLTINTPFTMDSAKYVASIMVGSLVIHAAGAAQTSTSWVEINSTTTLRPLYNNGTVTPTSPATFASGDFIFMTAHVPISTWSG